MQETKEDITFVHAGPEDANMFHMYQTQLHGESEAYFSGFKECESRGTQAIKDFILDSLKSSASSLFILKDMTTREILAHVHIQVGQAGRNRHRADIYIGVLKQFQNAGVGKKLMEIVDFWAKKENVERIQLSVFSTNEKANSFYQNLGYEEEGRFKKAIKFEDGSYADEIVMVKFVEPLNL
ncbi:MAG: GNAT family N-acetyltransferase [Proteobacteria bacterium]|nr:GNAT family N-acetyltransferase [Pseudomonadota bacterium]